MYDKKNSTSEIDFLRFSIFECVDWLRSIFYCYLHSKNSDDGNSHCCAGAVVIKMIREKKSKVLLTKPAVNLNEKTNTSSNRRVVLVNTT